MKRFKYSIGPAVIVGSLMAFTGTASAAGPQPPTCYAQITNNGQIAQLTLSSLGAHGDPGLSAFNQGGVAAFGDFLHSLCGY